MKNLLEGLKIIDISEGIAGAFCGNIFSDFGSDVIKVETKGGDEFRKTEPKIDDISISFLSVNRNKKDIELDLNNAKQKAVFEKLVAKADVLIESFGPGKLEEMDLAPDKLRQSNNKLIVTRISPYGQTGPNANKKGYSDDIFAYSGMQYMNGNIKASASLAPYALVDYDAGLYAAYGTLLALYYRDKNNETGQDIDCSLYESMFRQINPYICLYDKTGTVWKRQGAMDDVGPGGLLESKDGKWVVYACSNDSTFHYLLQALDREELWLEANYCDSDTRIKHTKEINEMVTGWAKQLSIQEVIDKLNEYKVPVCLINNISDVVKDEQVVYRKNIVEVDCNDNKLFMPSPVPLFSNNEVKINSVPTVLGKDKYDILEELNLDKNAVDELYEDGGNK